MIERQQGQQRDENKGTVTQGQKKEAADETSKTSYIYICVFCLINERVTQSSVKYVQRVASCLSFFLCPLVTVNGESLLTDKVTGEESSIRNVSNGLEESQSKRKSERRSGDANEETEKETE